MRYLSFGQAGRASAEAWREDGSMMLRLFSLPGMHVCLCGKARKNPSECLRQSIYKIYLKYAKYIHKNARHASWRGRLALGSEEASCRMC